jgi:uncharacterized protein (TIGR03437 family)
MCALLLFPYLSFAAAQLNLTALPGAFPYSYAALDPAGNIYLAGATAAAIPLVNPIQSTVSAGNCSDEVVNYSSPCSTAFVAKLDPTGTKILYSTYLGATQEYVVSGLAVDTAGNAYVSGTASAPSPLPPPSAGQAFLFKVNPTGSTLVYNLSIAAYTSGSAVGVDSAGNAYFAGASLDANFPTLHSTLTVPPAQNFFVTHDGGATWQTIAGISAQAINSLAIDPTHTATLYAATSSGLYKSLDGGATWTQLLPAATTAQQILLDPKNPSTLYVLYGAATQGTQFAKSTDGGATWQNLTAALPPPWVPGIPLNIGTIALDPENSQSVWMSIAMPGSPSVFVSSDGGLHWQDAHDFKAFFVATAANPGSTGANVFVDPTNSSRIYSCCTNTLGAQTHGVFRSGDGGKTWTAGSPGFVNPPVLDPANPTTLYAPGNALGVSTDAGQTWTTLAQSSLAPNSNAGNLAVDPSGGLDQIFDYGTLLKSKDGGNTWTAVTGPWVQGSNILALDPVNPTSTIYVGSLAPSPQHAFLAKIDPSGAYLWATVFGGSQGATAQAVAVDAAGNPYVAGLTTSLDFPTLNAFQSSTHSKPAGAHASAFVTRFSSDGQLVYSSYLGGSFDQTVAGIAVDAAGNAYVAGYTESSDFPTVKPLQATPGYPLTTGFVSKVNPSGSALVYSTYVGGSDRWATSTVSGIALTSQGGVWLAGTTGSIALPLVQALQPSNAGGRFLAEIDPGGASWDFSTYSDRNFLGMAPVAGGNLWLATAGSTGVLNFGPPPATPAGVPLILSVYNAASYHLSDTVAPGEAVAIFGEQLAPAAQQALSYPLPPSLGGVSVTVGGIAAPLYFVSPGQINFQVPYGVQATYGAPPVSATLVVTNGSQSGQRTLYVVAGAPGIFTASGDGSTDQAYVVHTSDYSRVTQSNPAKAGEYLAIFCTGLGATDPPSVEGQPAQAAPVLPTSLFIVDVDGREALPSYAGLAPGFAGLYQVNFQLFSDQQSGMRMLIVASGLSSSQFVPLWVQ